MEAFEQTTTSIYMFTMWWLPILTAGIGLGCGLVKFIKSVPYMYHYYVEHGVLPVWMGDDRGEKDKMAHIIIDNGLDEDFKPVGYFTGFVQLLPWTIVGALFGFLWPLVTLVGIFTIPGRVIKYVARNDRKKAMFEQALEGKQK